MATDKEHCQKLGEKMLETLEMDIKGSELVRAMAKGIFRGYCQKIKRRNYEKTTDHSYESIQQALQIAVDNNGDVVSASEQSGVPKRTLYRYFERMHTGQQIRGVHSRGGTSALFRVDEHGQVQFEMVSHVRDRRKAVTMGEVMEQLEKVNEKLSTIAESVKRLETKLKELQME